MRLPGAVGIDFRDRRGASEILTSLMLVYVANLGMDYVDPQGLLRIDHLLRP